MTREETKYIINRVLKLYMNQSRNLSQREKAIMVDTWAEEFENSSYEDVNKAVSQYAKIGKPFMPNVPDIIQELISMEDTEDNGLFKRLAKAADMAANPTEHIVIDDIGGFRWSDEHKRKIYFHAETHVTTDFTQGDFAVLPDEIQEYADDIAGLIAIHHEIESNRILARMRFVDRLPDIRRQLDANSQV